MKLFLRILLFFIFFNSNIIFANEDISLELKWKNQFQFAGFYMAKEKGFYDDVGLNVKIDELNEKNPINSVLNGKYDFAVGDSTVIFEKMQNKGVVALFSIFQHSPLVLVGLQKNLLDHPNKLQNKIIEIPNYSVGNITIQNLLLNSGINFIKKEPTYNIKDLIEGKTDLISGYISNEPFRIKENGYDSLIIDPKDWGIDFYGDILYTSKKLIEEKPQVVENFYHASMKGWLYAFENIEETVNIILEKYNTQKKSKESLIFEGNTLKKLAGDLNDFGKLDILKIKQIASTFALKLNNKYDFEKLNSLIYEHNISNQIILDNNEKQFLSKNKEFTICTQYNFYPFDGYKDGKVIGIMGDYLEALSKNLNISFKPIPSNSHLELNEKVAKGECDLISAVSPKSKRFKNISVTKAFLWDDFWIITSVKVPTINVLEEVENKTFYVLFEVHKKLINLSYPSLNIKVLNDTEKIMKIISKDNNSSFLSLGVNAERIIQKYGFTEYKVNDILTNTKVVGGIGVKNEYPILKTILDKTIIFLEKEKTFDQIRQRYMLKEYVINEQSKNLLYLLALLVVILLYTLYRYHITKVEKLELQERLNNELKAEKTAIIQLNTAGIFHIKNRRFLWTNEKFNEMLGFNKDELLNKETKIIYKKIKDYEEVTNKIQNALKNDKTFNGQITLNKKDGTDIIVDYSANIINNLENHKNDEIEFLAMIIDITDKKRQEIELKELNENLEQKVNEQTKKIKEQALKDPLTNAYNRKAYNEKIIQLINDYQRYKIVFSILYVDLDDFKLVNDNYGHHMGDEILINFYNIVKPNIRVNDEVYRMGGEEFIILLPNTNLVTAKIVANKLLNLIRENLKVDKNHPVTISGGLIEIDDKDSAESLYKRVDKLLYISKNSGKNKITVCDNTNII